MDGNWFDWFKVLGPVLLTQGLGFFVAIYLFKRNEDQKSKRSILYALMGSRHARGSNEYLYAINSIDIVFSRDIAVRNAAQKFIAALSSETFNSPQGFFIADEARVDLIMSIVNHMNMENSITRADVMRAYAPEIVGLRSRVDYMELRIKEKKLEEELSKSNE